MNDPQNDCFVAVDAGTQSIRAALIDVRGEVLAIAQTSIEPYFSAQPGWAEQDARYYWKKFCETTRRLSQTEPFRRDAVKGVSVTTQRGTYVNVDASGEPLRPAIVWLDQREASPANWAPPLLKFLLKITGRFDRVDRYYRKCYANWIREHQPAVWDKTHKYLLLSGYFTYKLTGEYVESLGCNTGYLPIDNTTHRWAGEKAIESKLFPIERSKLPDLVAQTEVMGEITAVAAEETGLPQGLPLIASASDKACEILGSGTLTSDTACLSYGTIATANAVSEQYVEIVPNFPAMPSAAPGLYYTEMPVFRGFWMVTWFKEQFGFKEELLAKEQNTVPEILLDELIQAVPPGSDGLILQPYWSPFFTYCGDEGRGSIIGFTAAHTRGHLYRAVLEGIAYELKKGTLRTEKALKRKFARLRVSGGGSKSDAMMQITADVFGLPAERPHTNETSALGAAMDAAVGLGYYPNCAAAVAGMTRVRNRFMPIPENQARYSELYHQVYEKMYDRLMPLFKEIRNTLGS